ncbi:MAG: hypothetical protein ABI566_00345 [Pseudolysinimonas sp.]
MRPLARVAGWVVTCAGAEAIGMGASASAARLADGLPPVAWLAIVIVGGLVEGTALGVLQARWLGRRIPGLSRVGWIVVTLLIAGVGWALASAPSALGSPDGQPAPPMASVLLGAAALGAVMGALMGVAQALVLRHHVHHPWRWIGISAAAWTPAMVVIFAGATIPDASWPTPEVIALGVVTGVVAGGLLGAISGGLMKTLTGPSIWSGMLSPLIRRNLFGLGRSFALLRVTGARTGRVHEFPVQFARNGDVAVVYAANAQNKAWWRNFRQPSWLSIWIDNGWKPARGDVAAPASPAFADARTTYRARWRGVPVGDSAVLVRIELRP